MEQEILKLLTLTNIPKSSKRANITGIRYTGKDNRNYGFPIQSFTLGSVRDWSNGLKTISNATKENQELYQLLIEYGKTICSHPFESICINKNVVCQKHRDINNKGISTIVALGTFTGGHLGMEISPTESISIDIHSKPFSFDGGKITHWTEPFDGTRYSIIYFK